MINTNSICNAAMNELEQLFLNDLQAHRNVNDPTTSKRLSARYDDYKDDNEIDDKLAKEIEAAMVQEITAEVIQECLHVMKGSSPQTVSKYDATDEVNDMYSQNWTATCHTAIDMGFELAKRDIGAQWAVVSPTVLTVIQTHGVLVPSGKGYINSHGNLMSSPTERCVYKYRDVLLYVDQYASDRQPVILGTAGAFTLLGQGIATNDTYGQFYSSYGFTTDRSKLAMILIELNSLGCFL